MAGGAGAHAAAGGTRHSSFPAPRRAPCRSPASGERQSSRHGVTMGELRSPCCPHTPAGDAAALPPSHRHRGGERRNGGKGKPCGLSRQN